MARICNLHSSKSVNDTAAAAAQREVKVNKSSLARRSLLLVAVLALGAGSLPVTAKEAVPSVVALKSSKDPLAGDVWHAVNSSWPGTIVFNSTKKSVTLTPVGAAPMEASYTLTVSPSKDKAILGTLRMTNAANQVSESTFRIEGKTLVLSFAGGQRTEQYVRMTPQEEAAEKARLEKMISEGRIRPIR